MLFVVQHHLATADHYDLRLEVDGVLVSWAVPRGPSTDPGVRRLARRVGDHALAHASVEGAFGPRRGGGVVVVQVWDRGTYTCADDPAAALARGHLTVDLAGEKLRGGWTLLRTGERDWLLLKKRDAHADAEDITAVADRSVLTGRTMAQIAHDG